MVRADDENGFLSAAVQEHSDKRLVCLRAVVVGPTAITGQQEGERGEDGETDHFTPLRLMRLGMGTLVLPPWSSRASAGRLDREDV